jgi:hypothetical protein
VGNHWEYEPVLEINPQVLSATMDIPSKYFFEGREYFVIVSKYTYPYGTSIDSVFYRMDSNGFVYETMKNFPEEANRYRLAATNNESWKIPYRDDYDLVATTTVIQSLTLNNTELENCKSYYFDSPGVVDEEHYVILAPGLGIIKRGSAWGFDIKLKKAIIDGNQFNF